MQAFRFGHLAEVRREHIGRPPFADLHRAAQGRVLHGQRELLEQHEAALGGGAIRSLLARAGQPDEDRLIEVGALFGQTPLVPVHHGQRREHDRVARHAADLGAGAECAA